MARLPTRSSRERYRASAIALGQSSAQYGRRSSRAKSSSSIRASAEAGCRIRYVFSPTSTTDSNSPVRPPRCAWSASRGSLSADGGGFAGVSALALCGGELGYAVASEDPFERLAGLIPDLARGAQGGVGDVADPAGRTAGGTYLAVQDLHDVQDGDLLRGHRKAIPSVGPAAALEDVGPPEFAEDLLQKPLRDALAAGDLCHPQRTVLFVERKDRKSTRLNSSHANISYAVFCLKKKRLLFN